MFLRDWGERRDLGKAIVDIHRTVWKMSDFLKCQELGELGLGHTRVGPTGQSCF